MRKFISWVLLFLISLSLIGCKQTDGTELFLLDDIDKLTISWYGGPNTTFSYTDSAKIDKFAEYFKSLKLTPLTKDPPPKVGGAWVITIIAGWNTYEMALLDTDLKMPAGNWCAIPREQANQFQSLMKLNIPDEMPKTVIFDEWQSD